MQMPKVLSSESVNLLTEYYLNAAFQTIVGCLYKYGLAIFVLLVLLVLTVTTILFCRMAFHKRQQRTMDLEIPVNPEDGEDMKHYDYAVKTDQNMRSYQEDRYCVHHTTINGKPLSFYGIFDGHGGCHAAQYCAIHLYENILKSSSFPEDMHEALTDGFLTTDEEYKRIASTLDNPDGTTVCVCIIYEDTMYLAHVGDTRAVVISQDQEVHFSTHDHKPNRQDEKERIVRLGGQVVSWGVWRVNGVLAVSRSIGDYELKHYVIANPEIVTVPLDGCQCINNESNDEKKSEEIKKTIELSPAYVVLASDGLWDVVKSSEVGSWIAKWSQDSENTLSTFCDHLVSAAKYRNSDDNITVMSILIHPFVPLSKEANSQSTEQKEDSEHLSSLRTFLLKHDRSTPNLDAYNVQSAIEEEEEVDVNSGVTIIENDQIINLKHRLAN